MRTDVRVRLPGTYPAQGDTELLAGVLTRGNLVAGRSVLDVGTGGGALALAASRAGARNVTAVDLSLRSILTARVNSWLAGESVRVVRGDLFEPVRGRQFDVVLANPPYVPAASDRLPRHRPGRSWDAGLDGRAVIDRICHDVGSVLRPGGRLLMVHSVISGESSTLQRLQGGGFDVEVLARVQEPFGPVMRGRAEVLRSRGLLSTGQASEELVVFSAVLAGVGLGRQAEPEEGELGDAARRNLA